jgi:hypothetical protein
MTTTLGAVRASRSPNSALPNGYLAGTIQNQLRVPRLQCTFDEHLASREPQALALRSGMRAVASIRFILVTGKHIAQRPTGTVRMVEFLGRPLLPMLPREHLEAVQRAVDGCHEAMKLGQRSIHAFQLLSSRRKGL